MSDKSVEQKKPKWTPEVGERVVVYNAGTRKIGTVIGYYSTQRLDVEINGSKYVLHRNQLRRLVKKPKRELAVTWLGAYVTEDGRAHKHPSPVRFREWPEGER